MNKGTSISSSTNSIISLESIVYIPTYNLESNGLKIFGLIEMFGFEKKSLPYRTYDNGEY